MFCEFTFSVMMSQFTFSVTFQCKEAWELDAGEKIEQAEQMKQQGTQHFKNTKYASAKKCYEKVIDYLKSEDSLDGEEKSKRDTLLLQGEFDNTHRVEKGCCHWCLGIKTISVKYRDQHCTTAISIVLPCNYGKN